MKSERQRGFSLLEMVIIITIIMIVASISIMNIVPALRNARVETALNTTVMQMRRARQAAVDDRRIHIITFTAPQTIRIERLEQDGVTLTQLVQLTLPSDIRYQTEPGIPTDPTLTPDQFGVGAVPIDFNNANQVFFQPDGSALDGLGRTSNGVIYMSRTGELGSARAVTLFGSTGRIKGWRLADLGAGAWGWK